MNLEFYEYDDKETDVYVARQTLSDSTFHIGIENYDSGDAIRIYMTPEDAQQFIHKLQKSLDEWCS
ncbi:hypothetical protein ABE073_04720 [Lederbergia citrisecunda]|uniref:hypothetical protein n=1 Tax=Lederbergia citrisecunda TaxID=2833583 RepID=UPI003D295263